MANDVIANSKKLSFSRKTFNFTKDYFVNSNQKLSAWLYLGAIFLTVLGSVALMVLMSWWFPIFLAAIASKMVASFLLCMAQFAGILTGIVICSSLKDYLVGKLSIRWREWLTNKLVNDYLDKHNYLAIARTPEVIENIGQCIQEDVLKVPNLTLNIVFGLVRSFVSIGYFGTNLWLIGGALSFVALGLNFVIPGYFLWVALGFAIVSSVCTHLIARSLAQKTLRKEIDEAKLREGVEVVNKESGNIASEKGEKFHAKAIQNKMENLRESSKNQLITQSLLVAFQSFYTQMTFVLPFLAAAPMLFAGQFTFDEIFTLSLPFGETASSFGSFVTAYKDMTDWKAAMNRIFKVEDCFDENRAKVEIDRIAVEQNISVNPLKNSKPHPAIIVFPGDRKKPGRENKKSKHEGSIYFKNLSLQKDPKKPEEGVYLPFFIP